MIDLWAARLFAGDDLSTVSTVETFILTLLGHLQLILSLYGNLLFLLIISGELVLKRETDKKKIFKLLKYTTICTLVHSVTNSINRFHNDRTSV